MTTHLQREINSLKHQVLTLSAEVENSIYEAYNALIQMDIDKAKKVIANDDTIDQREVDIEEDCLKLMALHQPVAGDLRLVIGLLKMNNDLERMGDLAANICQYIIKIAKFESIEISPKFNHIFSETREMVRNSLDSLVNSDGKLARKVCLNDDVVDQINIEIIKDVQKQIQKTPHKTRSLLLLISITRSIERIADYATNIAEDVIYMVNGQIVRHRLPPPRS